MGPQGGRAWHVELGGFAQTLRKTPRTKQTGLEAMGLGERRSAPVVIIQAVGLEISRFPVGISVFTEFSSTIGGWGGESPAQKCSFQN